MANRDQGSHELTGHEVGRILDIQEQEVKVRGQEMVLRTKEIDANAKAAEKTIEAQLQIEKLRQQAFLSQNKMRGWILAMLIGGSIAIVITAIIANKESVAIELLKQAAIIAGSFAGGYAVGRKKND